ncbi:hypothetical protein P3342_001674 [Pyrenophora teres f. teres]|nr:hypothetical protein P3342_001674 [Pyrenophora teres f. teres]
MANSPSTFQRYINWTLREYLDEFCSAYLDDVLIYTDGSLRQHQDHVRKVLSKLQSAGLHVDIKKCEFEVKSTKYLGFIIDAGKGISMDPDKVKAIKEWEAPKTVKGVRSFLGFANFYRKFIRDFVKIATPLTRLTGDVSFTWGKDEQAAFDKLKEIFVMEPILATFDSERDTVLECDSSGYATGGVLSQYDEEGILRPCAYFSRKNNAHECNYEIHDKELLAVVRCLEEWDAELRSVKSFKVITDHKNLEYFMKPKMLSERQIRWAALLSRFNMEILREQDLPEDAGDERLQKRIVQILKPTSRCYEEASDDEEDSAKSWVMSAKIRVRRTGSCPSLTEEQSDQQDAAANESGTDQSELEKLWLEALKNDRQYQQATQAVLEQERRFPPSLGVKYSISECAISDQGELLYRGRRWVPSDEKLRTRIIGEVHDSLSAGHPGREIAYKIVARDFFWPGMSDNIRRYVRNCDVCGRTKPWREGTQGFLKPLPIPDQIWKEISMDFIEGLPISGGMSCLMVVTDRLSKGAIFVPLPDIKTETVVRAFLSQVVAYHWLPNAITSDRGSQFVSVLWECLCEVLKINRRLSTAFQPQTDGATERMNSVWEAYVRAFISWSQDDWATYCPMAQIAINGRDATSTGLKALPSTGQRKYTTEERSDREKAETIAAKFRDVFDLVQASMAEAQVEQEKQTNRHRKEARNYKVGDKVWLKLDKQYRTGRQSRKLDWKSAKYTVIEVIDSHSVKLDTLQATTQSSMLTDYVLPTQIPYQARYKTTISRCRYK